MKTIIEKLYRAFGNLDAEGMAMCYHHDIIFEDPVFGVLHGERAMNMWRMLCRSQRGEDFKVEVSNIWSDHLNGSARWEAFYFFKPTGRKVHNIIDAEFKFHNGKIIRHTDRFNLYRWSRQAMGFKGLLIGWTNFFKKQLMAQTNRRLTEFSQKR